MIEQALILSLLIIAIWYSMQPDEIFGRLGGWLSDVLPLSIQNPVFDCPACMTPWYGSLLYWVLPWQEFELNDANIKWWPAVVLVAMGLNVVIIKLWPEKSS